MNNGNGVVAIAERSIPPAEERGTTEVAPVRPAALLPSTEAWRQMGQMAVAAYKSGLMPDGVRNQEAALVTALKGYELGVPFMAAIEGIHIIKGKATVGAHLMLALIKRAYGGGAMRVAKTDSQQCIIQYREPGWDEVNTFTFTWEDAQKAKLTTSETWQKYPAAMLRARAISAAGKLAFPEVVGGLYVAGELGDAVVVTEDGDVVPDLRVATATVVDHPPERIETRGRPQDAPEPTETIEDVEYRDVAPSPSDDGPGASWTTFWPWARANGLVDNVAIEQAIGHAIGNMTPRAVYQAVMASQQAPEQPAAGSSGTPIPDVQKRKPPDGIKMTERQWWKMWACGNEKMPRQADEGLHAFIHHTFGHDSLKDVTVDEASGLIDWLEGRDEAQVMGYVGPLLRQRAIERGQQEMPMEAIGAGGFGDAAGSDRWTS